MTANLFWCAFKRCQARMIAKYTTYTHFAFYILITIDYCSPIAELTFFVPHLVLLIVLFLCHILQQQYLTDL